MEAKLRNVRDGLSLGASGALRPAPRCFDNLVPDESWGLSCLCRAFLCRLLRDPNGQFLWTETDVRLATFDYSLRTLRTLTASGDN